MTAPSPEAPWSGLRPDEVFSLLAGAKRPWWISGGWAIDLFAGRPTRRHEDTDVGCLRGDVDDLVQALEGWEHFVASEGRLSPLAPSQPVAAEATSLWSRRAGSARWDIQIMIEESRGPSWVYRRDTRVRRPLAELTWTTSIGCRALEPEIQLLYKSKAPRPRDEHDLAVALGTMSPAGRSWLEDALRVTAPGHPWLSVFA